MLGHRTLRRGRWAGNRFDIVVEDKIDTPGTVGGVTVEWKDASDTIAQEMDRVGNLEIGPNWKTILSGQIEMGPGNSTRCYGFCH